MFGANKSVMNMPMCRGMVAEQQGDEYPFSKIEQTLVCPVNQFMRIRVADLTEEKAKREKSDDTFRESPSKMS